MVRVIFWRGVYTSVLGLGFLFLQSSYAQDGISGGGDASQASATADKPFFIPRELESSKGRVEFLRGISEQFPQLLSVSASNGSNLIELFDKLVEIIGQENMKRFITADLFDANQITDVVTLDERVLEPSVASQWGKVLNESESLLNVAPLGDLPVTQLFQSKWTALKELNAKSGKNFGNLTGLLHASLGQLTGPEAGIKKSQLFSEMNSFILNNEPIEPWIALRLATADPTKFRGQWPTHPQASFSTALSELRSHALTAVQLASDFYRTKNNGAPPDVRQLLDFSENLDEFSIEALGSAGDEAEKDTRFLKEILEKYFSKPLIKKEKGEVPFKGELVVVPALYALVRGFLSGDCATSNSPLFPLSEYERVAMVRKEGEVKGYVAWTIVRNGKLPAIYIHTVQGDIFSNEIKTLLRMVKTYMITKEKMPQDLSVTIPTTGQITSLMHSTKIQGELSRLSRAGETVFIDYWDNRFRDILEADHNHSDYDSPLSNEEVRLLLLEPTPIAVREIPSTNKTAPLTREDRRKIFLLLESSESGSSENVIGYLRPGKFLTENMDKVGMLTKGRMKFYEFWTFLENLPEMVDLITPKILDDYVHEKWIGILPSGAKPSMDPTQSPGYVPPVTTRPILRYRRVRGRRVPVFGELNPGSTDVQPVGRFIKDPEAVYGKLEASGKYSPETMARFQKMTARFVGSGSCQWLWIAVTAR